MTDGNMEQAVLAIYPFSRGFSFVLFDGPASVFDWAIKEIKEKRSKNEKTLKEIKSLLDTYLPMVIVIEDIDAKSRRSSRIKKLYAKIARLAEKEDIGLCRFSYDEVCEYVVSLPGATKHQIAMAVAKKIPGFLQYMPPPRKAWMSEHPRQALFDAAALGLTFYSCWNRLGPEETDGLTFQ